MKTQLQQWPGHWTPGSSMPGLAVSLLLTVLPAKADTEFTANSWPIAGPVPGILCTNTSGQVYLKGNVHVVRVKADDARVTGRMQAGMDLAYQTDGTAIFSGSAYSEVGVWDAAGTNFMPTGGTWNLHYRGNVHADGSTTYSMTGYGIGEAIEGLRVELTVTRADGDPATPYVASGTIKPAPVNTSVLLDDFEDGIVKSQWTVWCSGQGQLVEADGQLTVRGTWDGLANQFIDHSGAYWVANWNVAKGRTLEWRADVTSMNKDASGVGILVGTSSQSYYIFDLTPNSISLDRWSVSGAVVPLFKDIVTVRQTNVVLSFALTRCQSNAVVTVRVLDKSAPNSVLYNKSVMDIPSYLIGNNVALAVDPKSTVWNPVASATFDNFELRTYEVPQVTIEPSACITWPANGVSFSVETAPTVQGPWLPVQDSELPCLKQKTVPANENMKFFRLRQAP